MIRSFILLVIILNNSILFGQNSLDSLMFFYPNRFWSGEKKVFVQGSNFEKYSDELSSLFEEWRSDPNFYVKYEHQLDTSDLNNDLIFFGPFDSYNNLRKYLPPSILPLEDGFKIGSYSFTDSLDAISIITSDCKRRFAIGNSLAGCKSLWTTFEISQYFIMQNYAISHHGFLSDDKYDPSRHYDVRSLRKKQMLVKSTDYYNFYYDPSIFVSSQNLDSLFKLEDEKLFRILDFFNLSKPQRKIDCFLYKDLEQKYYFSATPGYGNPFTFAYQNHSVGFSPVEHETIHILFDNQVGNYSTFLSEGVVGYYYSTKDSIEWKKTKMIVTSYNDSKVDNYLNNPNNFSFSQKDYAFATFFVKFLNDTYGLDRFKSFFNYESIEEGFQKSYSKSISQISSEWEKYYSQNKTVFGSDKKIVFKVYAKNVLNNFKVFITGSNDILGSWNPSKVNLEKRSDGSWEKEFVFPQGTILEYKITRGSWDKEALDANGNVPQNSVYEVKEDDIINIYVNKWKDDLE
jgi:hypothetical protein